jgi:hypothetical protein
MVSKGKEYKVYGRHVGNLTRCLNTFDTHEQADRFAKTMTRLGWRNVNIFHPAMRPCSAPDNRPSVAELST